jgi:hypothetical protein
MPKRANNGQISQAIAVIHEHGSDFTCQWLRERCGIPLKQAHNAITQALARGVAYRTGRGRYRAHGV